LKAVKGLLSCDVKHDDYTMSFFEIRLME